MANQDWSIKIVETGSPDAFEPDVIGGQPGQPLQAQNADLVSWNNRTGDQHWPWPADEHWNPLPEEQAHQPGTWLSDEIAPWSSSTPAYLCTAPSTGSTTIQYVCYLHQEERGTIIVSA